MKAGALPAWPRWAGRGPSDPPTTTPFLSCVLWAQRASPWGPALEPGALLPLCARGSWWGGDREEHGQRRPEEGPHPRLDPGQGPREGDCQQSCAAPGPDPGPPVGPLSRAAAAASARARPRRRRAAGRRLSDLHRYPFPASLPRPRSPPARGPDLPGHSAAPGSARGGARGSAVTGSPAGAFSLTAAPILRYMGDYPSRKAWTSLELTDQIFSAALQEAALQDEVYCQILKQLTHNTKRSVGTREGQRAPRARVAVPRAPSGLAPAPEAVSTVQRGRQPLIEATLAVTVGRLGPGVSPTSWAGQSRRGGRPALGPPLSFVTWAGPGLSKPRALLHEMGTVAPPTLLVGREALAALAAGQRLPCPGPQAGLSS